jgi:hypothetical protein
MTEPSNGAKAMSDAYQIRVDGHLDDCWSDWLEGLAIERQADGATTLTGPIVDQSALYGVIARIRDLGLPLLSITRIVPNDDAPNQNDEKGAPLLEKMNRSTLTNRRAALDGEETK